MINLMKNNKFTCGTDQINSLVLKKMLRNWLKLWGSFLGNPYHKVEFQINGNMVI